MTHLTTHPGRASDAQQRSDADCHGSRRHNPLGFNRAALLSRELETLAHPDRILILIHMGQTPAQPMPVDELRRHLDLSDDELHGHLAAMHRAGLLYAHGTHAQHGHYSLAPERLRDLATVLSRLPFPTAR